MIAEKNRFWWIEKYAESFLPHIKVGCKTRDWGNILIIWVQLDEMKYGFEANASILNKHSGRFYIRKLIFLMVERAFAKRKKPAPQPERDYSFLNKGWEATHWRA